MNVTLKSSKGTGRVQRSLALALVLLLTAISIASAGAAYQPVEWEKYTGGPKWSLTSLGLTKGCKPDQPNNYDYKYRVNMNVCVDSDHLRIYSDDGWTRFVLAGKSPMGVNLNGSAPYLCIGQTDTTLAGGSGRLAGTLYVWAR